MATLLSVNNYYYPRGGAEVVFLEHNAMMSALGWEVVPFSMQHPKNLETRWSDYFVEEIEYGTAYSAWGKLRRVPKVIYSFEARRKLSALLRKVDVDVCHAHNVYHHISPSIYELLKANAVPVVVTLHDLKLACPAYKMLTHDGICERCKGGRIYNVVRHRCVKQSISLSTVAMFEAAVHKVLGSYSRNVDRFVVPSRFYLDKLIEWGWSADRFVYVPNFVDVASFEPQAQAGRAVLYFGRLAEEKGIATLIRAAGVAKVPLLIAGVGPERAKLSALAENLGADVSFLGFLSGARLHDVIRSSRAVVLPSEWYENAPLSIMESYALGKPVIGAAIGGIPELIRIGDTGFSFESRSVESLSAALEKLSSLSDKTVADMGRCGREWVEAEFSRASYRERIYQLYRELKVRC